MLAHCHDLGDDSLVSPFNTKYLCELLQILSRRLTDRKDGVTQPTHAQTAKLLVKELDTKL